MPSQLKSDTGRANGAQSHGPATPEGRAKSSRNSLRHGLSAKSVVLPTESPEQFQILLDAHIQQFRPANDFELELVEAMAAARWRLRRICAIETNLLATEIERRAKDVARQFTEIDDDGRLARYEGTLSRAFDRAFKQLTATQSRQRPQQNEPTPEPAVAPQLDLSVQTGHESSPPPSIHDQGTSRDAPESHVPINSTKRPTL